MEEYGRIAQEEIQRQVDKDVYPAIYLRVIYY
jgi:hypothetical protein